MVASVSYCIPLCTVVVTEVHGSSDALFLHKFRRVDLMFICMAHESSSVY